MAADQQPLPIIHLIACQSSVQQAMGGSLSEQSDLRLEQIKEFLQASNLALNTQKSYRLELKRFVAWSDKAWIDVTPKDIARFKKYLKDECRTRRGSSLSPAAINQAITALKSFFKWFQTSGYLNVAAVLPTTAVKFERLSDPLPRHLSAEQMESIYQSLVGDEEINLRDRALLAVLTHGLRAEDISTLKVENYDGTRLRFIRKKDKSEAIVPLRQTARESINTYLERRRTEQSSVQKAAQREILTDEDPLFLSYDFRSPGQRLGYQGIYYFTKVKLGEATGIRDLTPHRFRHTYATELVELGIDTFLARSLTGHKSERVFERYVKGRRMAAAEEAFFRAIGE
jgi:integrase/recombinase XerD